MLRFNLLFIGLMYFCCSLLAQGDVIRTVRLKSFEEKDFQRISEYFSGHENYGLHTILRTNEKKRAGLYFIVSCEGSLRDCFEEGEILLEYVQSGASEVQKAVFVIPECRGLSHELYLGLTHVGCREPQVSDVLAWRVSFLKNSSEICVAKQSFAWSIACE